MSFDDLNTYNGDTEHNMWVNFDNFENNGSPVFFDDPDLDNFIDNLNDRD